MLNTNKNYALLIKKLIEIGIEHNFSLMESNTIQSLETLIGKYEQNADIINEVFKLPSMNEGLRYDLTTPLVNQFKKQEPRPAKRMELGRVFRNGPVTAYRFKEFTQFDYDRTYSEKDKTSAMLDCLLILKNVLDLSGASFSIHLNSQELLQSAIKSVGYDSGRAHLMLKTIDKLSKHTLSYVLEKNPNVCESEVKELIEQLNSLEKTNTISVFEQAINSKRITSKFNPLLVRGLNFYTDLFFEVFDGSNTTSSILSGGFYNLSKISSENTTPCFGFSIGVNRFIKMIQPANELTLKVVIEYTLNSELHAISKLKLELIERIKCYSNAPANTVYSFNFEVKTYQQIRSIRGNYFLYSSSENFKQSNTLQRIDTSFYKKVINTTLTK
jgi:histidyl-tRNA synthetase